MTDLILIRHGETAWNAEKRMQGHLDIGLNDEGLRQAAALGRALCNEPIDAVVTSDLLRARQTAEPIGAVRGLSPTTDKGLRERCFGVFEGLLYADLERSHPDAYRAWKARELHTRYPPGQNQAETLQEFSDRVLVTIDRLAHAGKYRTLAVVTHGGVLECIYRAATGTSLQQVRDFDVKNAGINRVRWTPTGMRILQWADVTHLAPDALDEIGP